MATKVVGSVMWPRGHCLPIIVAQASPVVSLPWGSSACMLLTSRRASSVDDVAKENQSGGELLPFEAMPGPKGLPYVGTLLEVMPSMGSFNKHILKRVAQYGPIYREQMGSMTSVVITGVEEIKKMAHLEGRYPERPATPPWMEWRESHGKKKGVFISNGLEWRKMRTALEKQTMRPRNVAEYAGKINDVMDDFVARIRRVRKPDGTVTTMDNELFQLSLESVASLMYETRLGALSDNPDPKSRTFIKAVNNMFQASEYLMNLPQKMTKYLSPKWYKLSDESWTTIWTIGQDLIETKTTEVRAKRESDEEAGGFLAKIIGEGKLSSEELVASITELMAAAVDTTSNTMQVALHYVSHDPEVQRGIREELLQVVGPPPSRPTQAHINDMPYLRGVVRETLRMYSPAFGTVRTMPNDVELGGYRVPAGTLVFAATFVTSMDPKHFPEPELFRPERWMRDGEERALMNPFAYMPFGHGQRGCLGRRIAEMEVQLLTAKLCEHFDLVNTKDEPLDLATRLIIVPKTPVSIRFTDRSLDGQ